MTEPVDDRPARMHALESTMRVLFIEAMASNNVTRLVNEFGVILVFIPDVEMINPSVAAAIDAVSDLDKAVITAPDGRSVVIVSGSAIEGPM